MKNKIIIYTDGACDPNPGKGGWGAVINEDEKITEISGYDKDTTNNKMEMTAVIKALETFKKKEKIQIYTDSKYVKNGITVWIENWKFNGWRNARRKPVKNKDLWVKLDKLNEKHKIQWYWIKGHSDDKLNDRADELATNAIRKHNKNYKKNIVNLETINYEEDLIRSFEGCLNLLELFKNKIKEEKKLLSKEILKDVRIVLSELQSTCIEFDICLKIKKFNNKKGKKHEYNSINSNK